MDQYYFLRNMVRTIWGLLVIDGAFLWNVHCSDTRRSVEEGSGFILSCPPVNSSGIAIWSRNDTNLSTWTGNFTYQVTSARFNDSGVYTCTLSRHIKVFRVKVGRRPTVCFNSHNTTIICTAGGGNTPNTTVCLNVQHVFLGIHEVGRKCNHGNVIFPLDLDKFSYDTFNFLTSVTNSFGTTIRKDQLRNLFNKVIPQPPQYVEMSQDGVDSFNVSFITPPAWNPSKLRFSYVIIQDDLRSSHDEERKLVNLPFKIKVRRKPYSLVCLKIRMKYVKSNVWGDYSIRECQRTFLAAPSSGPTSVRGTSVPDKLHPGIRNVTVTWDLPDQDKRNGIIYQYSVTLEKETVHSINNVTDNAVLAHALVNGSVTRCTLSGIPSDQTIKIKVKAWTKAGTSPVSTYTLGPLPEERNEKSPVVWILVGCGCLAILLVFLRCFFVFRRKLFSDHLPEPSFIHPSKIPTFQTLPPQKELFDSLNQRPGSQPNPHRGVSVSSTSHSDWISIKQNPGRCVFTGTDSGISCDTESCSANQSCRCSDLSRNREISSDVNVCTYTGLPSDTNGFHSKDGKSHSAEEVPFSREYPDEVNECRLIPQGNNSCPGYKRPPPPRELCNDKYVPMGKCRTEESFKLNSRGNCCVKDSLPESNMDDGDDGYINMECNEPRDDEVRDDVMEEMLEQTCYCEEKEKLRKVELLNDVTVKNTSCSVTTLKGPSKDDESHVTKVSCVDFAIGSPHALHSCPNLKGIGKEESTAIVDKNVKGGSSECTKCSNICAEIVPNNVFVEDHKLNSKSELTISTTVSRIERDSGYTSDD